MARPIIAGIPYHIIHRGNNKQAVFFDDEDYSYFLELLEEGKEKYPIKIYSYILMTNHLHAMMEPKERESLPYFMRYVCAKYAQYINRHYNRSGTLWEGRYRSGMVGNERYFLAVQRYIEMNPLRAGMVRDLEEYPWSSHLYYAYGKINRLLDENLWYESLDETIEGRQKTYRKFFKETIPAQEWELIRETAKKQVVYGDNRFKQGIERQLKKNLELRQRGRPKRHQ